MYINSQKAIVGYRNPESVIVNILELCVDLAEKPTSPISDILSWSNSHVFPFSICRWTGYPVLKRSFTVMHHVSWSGHYSCWTDFTFMGPTLNSVLHFGIKEPLKKRS